MPLTAVPGVALAAPGNIELGTTSLVPAPVPTYETVFWKGPFPIAELMDGTSVYWKTITTNVAYLVPTATASQLAIADQTWWTFT